MDDLNGTALYAGILGIMAVALALNTAFRRVETKTAIAGDDDILIKRSRAFGNLVEQVDHITNELYWRLDQTDIRGNVTKELLGGSVERNRSYELTTGLINQDTYGIFGGEENSLIDMQYEWGTAGNLESKEQTWASSVFGGRDYYVNSTYEYDRMHRLKKDTTKRYDNAIKKWINDCSY